VSAADYSAKLSAPHLRQWLNRTEKHISSTVTIPEVVGDMDAHAISKSLEEMCKAEVLKADAASTDRIVAAKLDLTANFRV
jgi:G3E family GTPase